ALQIWQRPLVAMTPLGIIMLTYFARFRFPLGIPGGFLSVVAGTGIAWLLSRFAPGLADMQMSAEAVRDAWAKSAAHNHQLLRPIWSGREILDTLTKHSADILPLLSVIVPMGLFNLIGSLQNIESAEA